jgi:hypothetical protein
MSEKDEKDPLCSAFAALGAALQVDNIAHYDFLDWQASSSYYCHGHWTIQLVQRSDGEWDFTFALPCGNTELGDRFLFTENVRVAPNQATYEQHVDLVASDEVGESCALSNADLLGLEEASEESRAKRLVDLLAASVDRPHAALVSDNTTEALNARFARLIAILQGLVDEQREQRRP